MLAELCIFLCEFDTVFANHITICYFKRHIVNPIKHKYLVIRHKRVFQCHNLHLNERKIIVS